MASTIIAAPASIHAVACAPEHLPQPVPSRTSDGFDADDLGDDGRPTWLHHLEQHGYAVIRSVASPAQVKTARDMYWQFFTQHRGADRARPETWTRLAGRDPSGISFTDHALMQSEGAWYVRGLPGIKRAFAAIWRTDDLICSFDATIIWRPWWPLNGAETALFRAPVTEGLHLDQNPFKKPGFDCVQAMMPLYDVTPETGGLEVCADSHLPAAKKRYCELYPGAGNIGEFLMLNPKIDPLCQEGAAKVLYAAAGDLIVWDSRTVHGGKVGTGAVIAQSSLPVSAAIAGADGEIETGVPAAVTLARLTQTVCMTPRALASEETIARRRQFVAEGWGTTHCPHDARCPTKSRTPTPGWQPPKLSAEQLALV